MRTYKTDQEYFWVGEFGNEYLQRNKDKYLIDGNLNLFSEIIQPKYKIESIIEYGANIGLNIIAIKKLLPNSEISAVEINSKAVEELQKIDGLKVYHESILNFQIDYSRDFVLVKTVLIHINPNLLSTVYDLIYKSTKKYICIAEYFNTTPTEVIYRNIKDKLFKRDFAGEMLDQFNDLELVDYGFKYHRDEKYYDDLNWFLLQKH